MYDDYLFAQYEFKNFIKPYTFHEPKCDMPDKKISMDFTNEFEKELCMKWKSINIGKRTDTIHSANSSSSSSPTSVIIKSIENDLLGNSQNKTQSKLYSDFQIIKFNTPTSNMPINILPERSIEEKTSHQKQIDNVQIDNEKVTKQWLFQRQTSQSTLLSGVKDQPKKRACRSQRNHDHASSPQTKLTRGENFMHRTPLQSMTKLAISTSKKRNAVESIEAMMSEGSGANAEPKTPVSKRRLVLTDSVQNSPGSPISWL